MVTPFLKKLLFFSLKNGYCHQMGNHMKNAGSNKHFMVKNVINKKIKEIYLLINIFILYKISLD